MSEQSYNSNSVDANIATILANQEAHHTEFMSKFEAMEKRQEKHELEDKETQAETSKAIGRLNKFMWTCMGGFGAFEILHAWFTGKK